MLHDTIEINPKLIFVLVGKQWGWCAAEKAAKVSRGKQPLDTWGTKKGKGIGQKNNRALKAKQVTSISQL
jgi:hypothetical protein